MNSLSFRWRIILIVTAALLVVGISIYMLTKQQIKHLEHEAQYALYSEKLNAIHSTLNQSLQRLEKTGLPVAYRNNFQDRVLADLRTTYKVQTLHPLIVDAKGTERLWNDQALLSGMRLDKLKKSNGDFLEFKDASGWIIAHRFPPWNWTVLFFVSADQREAQTETLTRHTAVVILIVSLISCALITIILSRVTRPILTLTTASQAMSQGDLSHPLPPMRRDEIGVLTTSFQSMRRAIREQLRSLEEEVHERIAAEQELRTNEENLRTTLNSIGDAVIATDRNGRIVRINPVAETLTGWSLDEAEGRDLNDIFTVFNALTDESMESPVAKVLSSGNVVELSDHAILRSRTGEEYQISDSGAPIRNDEGEISGVVLVFRNITKEHALEEQLHQSQKMEAIGQLAGGIAHDFNNMLGGIQGAADLLKRRRDDPEKVDSCTSLIENAVSRASSLTKQLLSFARKQSLSFHPLPINKTIRDTIELLAGSIDKQVEITEHLSPEEIIITGDSAQLQSVLLNIGINASHAISGAGTVDFTTHTVFLDEAYCKYNPFKLSPGHYLQIEISDTGCGISPENMKRIFEPFYTTKPKGKGTGLGLSVAFGTIQQHNGAINVYSEVNKGTRFHILLPMSNTAELREPEIKEEIIKGSGHILLVDDEEIIRITGQKMLEELGYQVTLACNGQEALEIYQAAPHSFDLLILDMIMPKMGGYDCFKTLIKSKPEIRVIITSGFTHEDEITEMQTEGFCAFVHKPFKLSTLSQVIHNALCEERE